MSGEGQVADAHALASTAHNIVNRDEHAARVALEIVDDAVHQTLYVFDGDSNEKLRALLVPAHLPVIIGSVIKVHDFHVLLLLFSKAYSLTFDAGK